MTRTADDAVDVAAEVVWGLRQLGYEAYVSTRPPGLDVCLSPEYSLRRRVSVDEIDVEKIVGEVHRKLRRHSEPRFEIFTDGVTVWVNGDDGCCLGRFGLQGVDVHRTVHEQREKGQCLECTHGPTTRADWDLFVQSMKTRHNIAVGDKYLPLRLREK